MEIIKSGTWKKSVIVIYCDIKHEVVGGCNNWGDVAQQVEPYFVSMFPAGSLYTRADFETTDSGKWPQMSSLLERGHHFVIIVDDSSGIGQYPKSDLFFTAAQSIGEAKSLAPWVAVINREDAELPFGESPLIGDRYLWRAYGIDSPYEWNLAVARGFSLLATDHVEAWWTFGPPSEPPMPLYVRHDGDDAWEWGTNPYPVETLTEAVNWLVSAPAGSYMRQLSIAPGLYQENILITTRVELVADGGDVTIVGF